MELNKELIELQEYLNWRIDNQRKSYTASEVVNFFFETGWLLPLLPINHELFYPKNFAQYKQWKEYNSLSKIISKYPH